MTADVRAAVIGTGFVGAQHVDGARGSATWRQESPSLLCLAHDGTVETVSRASNRLGAGDDALAPPPGGHIEGWTNALPNLLAAAYSQIGGRREAAASEAAPLPTFDDGRRHLVFVEAALLTANGGRRVEVDEVLRGARQVAEVS